MTEKRIFSRIAFTEEVEITIEGDSSQPGNLVNISRGGCFVQTDPVPGFGSRVTLYINLPGIPERCEIPCIVRWVKENEGSGLQFEHLRPIEVWALNRLLRSNDKD